MQHIKPMGKGDPLCPLGFHPQVRWPTRCKRCFRDYKEHGNRNKEQSNKLNRNDTTAASSPSLSSWNSKTFEDKDNCVTGTRSWTSISNLNASNNQQSKDHETVNSSASSWTSTPNLKQLSDSTKPNSDSTSLTQPRRRPIKSISEENANDDDYRRTAYTVRRRTTSSLNIAPILEAENESSLSKNDVKSNHRVEKAQERSTDQESDVFTDAASTINTDDTETIINDNVLQDQIESLKVELNVLRTRCEKAEKEKNDMLLRRVASLDNSMSTKTTTSELYKLQEKVNALNETCETLQNEKRMLTSKIREFENAKKSDKNNGAEEEINSLKSKLQAAESLCEELMDENDEMKRELRDMEDEIEEMQDNFRENEADEYSSIKKELEQTAKNCRILSFKLRKCERKAEQLEADRFECERKSREIIQRLQKDLDEVNEKLRLSSIEDARRKAPMLGNIPKTPSGEKVSRASLTRGGSQEDPVQLLRDLQDSMEREADLREQLRYAEEEAENLRKKVSRVEDDNESLLMQLKKMATKAKSRRSSPTHSRFGNELSVEKDEGISDDDDPAELRLLLELNEQESAVLHKKIKELEETCDILKRKASDLQGKLLAKEQKPSRSWMREPSKAQETEVQELKNKLQEKERECIQLSSEISCLKRSSGLKPSQKARSTDNDRNSVDLQRQLKIVEQEASVLRTRISSLESENEKLQNENKQLTIAKISRKSSIGQTENELRSEIQTLKKQLNEARNKTPAEARKEYVNEIKELKAKQSELESENARLATSLKLLKEGNSDEVIEFLKKRTPKIITDSMSKETLKKIIEDLECEITEILLLRNKVNLNKASESNAVNSNSVSFELEKTKQKLEKLLNERKEEKAKFEKMTSEKRKMETAQVKQDETKEKEKSILRKEKDRLENEKKKLVSEIENLKTQIMNLNEDLRNSQSKHNETNDLLAATCRELEEKRSAMDALKRQLESALNSAKEDGKLKSELSEKKKKIAELERKLQDAEDKSKKSERLVQVKKEKLLSLEKEVESLKKEINASKNSKNVDSEVWSKKEIELKATIEDLRKQIEKKCDEIRGKDTKIKDLEKTISTKGFVVDSKSTSNNLGKLGDLEKKLSLAQSEVTKLNDGLKKLESEKKELEEKAKIESCALQSEINVLKEETEKLRVNFDHERTSMSQQNDEQMKQITAKDAELQQLKKKISNVGDKKINDVRKELESKLNTFKGQLEGKKREYDELTNKYEILEDEHVKLKSQTNLQREQMHSQVACTQKELTSVQNELRTLRDTYNSRQDNWIKEKLKLEDKITELESAKSNVETYKLELNKLKLMLEAKNSELEKVHKENILNVDQMDHMRKENEELQRKLDDYDKVINVQRNMVAEASLRESEMRELKNRLYNEEQGRKVEVAALKLRYENHVAAISSELKDVQAQVMRFKHERNTYKHLLENAQKAVSEVRNSATNKENTTNHDEFVDELRTQVATLEQQISCMEDELSESRVESSRLKTELVSERSAWDVKLSEMTSRINELEEERMLSAGRSKTVGLKTRIELSWQKEREEQNRLLQETSTLARDLRQTLFEVERERDKERLETKRRIDQMKKNADEEQEEVKRKLHELQCDLLELRDAHAKLRTTNEKLRREKERLDREKDLIKQNSRLNTAEYDQKKVSYILELIYELSRTNLGEINKGGLPPMPPNKKQSTPSRESSVDLRTLSRENSLTKEDANIQFQQMLQRLFEAARQAKSTEHGYETGFNKDVARKAFISRRPASTESDKRNDNPSSLQRQGSLYRKCVSLEHTSPSGDTQEQIWRMDDDTDGSITSIQSIDDVYLPRHKLDQSFDSRLSGGSTHSELLPSTLERKKKKGLLGKLKKLTKSSRNVNDDSSFVTSSASQGNPTGSNSSISSNIIPDQESSKRDLKHRIAGFFKSSDSRCNSLERTSVAPSSSDIGDSPGNSSRKFVESNTLPRRAKTSAKNDKSGIKNVQQKSKS